MIPVINHPIPIPHIIPLFIISLMIANPPRTRHRLHSLKFLAMTRRNRQIQTYRWSPLSLPYPKRLIIRDVEPRS